MLPSKFWTPCALIVTGLVIIIIILVCSSNEPYREHNDDSENIANNKAILGDFVKWDDQMHINTNWNPNNPQTEPEGCGTFTSSSPISNCAYSSGLWDDGYYLDSCGNCDGAVPCSKTAAGNACYNSNNKRQDVSVHWDNNRSSQVNSSTWVIKQIEGSDAGDLGKEKPTSEELVSYGDIVWLKNFSDGSKYLEVCGICNRGFGGCAGCNKNVYDVVVNPSTNAGTGISTRWKIISAIGIEEKTYVKYGEPLYLQNQQESLSSELNFNLDNTDRSNALWNGYQIFDNGGYQTRKTYLDVCGKCNSTADGTDTCAGSKGGPCNNSGNRFDVSTSYSPHRGTYGKANGGSGTWRFIPSTSVA